MKKLIYLAALSFIIISCNNSNENNSNNNKKSNSSAFENSSIIEKDRTEKSTLDESQYSLTVKLTPFIPSYPELGETGKSLLSNRINAAVSKIGFGGDGSNPRFIIGPSINLISKNITSTSPTKYANTYEVTLMTCDVVTETVFQTYTFQLKGVGDSPEKAFLNGFRDFNLNNEEFFEFLVASQDKIFAYYEQNCNLFLQDAETHANMREYDMAFTILNNIPMEAQNCYSQVVSKKQEYFQMNLNTDCQMVLANLKAEMGKANDPSASGFNSSAMSYYAMIDRSSSCYKEAEKIYQEYLKKLNPKAKRDWDYQMQQYQDKIKKLERDDQFRNDSTMANFDYLKHKHEMQAKAEIEGNKKLLQKYQYDQLPWLRKVFHLGKYDPFDGVDK